VARQRAKQAGEQAQVEPSAAAPTQEEITELAYSLWQARGCPEGCPEEDWLNAESALKARLERSRRFGR
jgi:hypothetical protein